MKAILLTFLFAICLSVYSQNSVTENCIPYSDDMIAYNYEKVINELNNNSFKEEYYLSLITQENSVRSENVLNLIEAQKLWIKGFDSTALESLYEILAETNDKFTQFKTELCISRIQLENGFTTEARARLIRLLSEHELNLYDASNVYAGIGYAYYEEMNYDSSYKYMSKALTNFKQLGCPNKSSILLLNISALQLDHDSLALAKFNLQDLISNYIDFLNSDDMAAAYGNLAYIDEVQGNFPEAISYYKKAISVDSSLSNDFYSRLYEGLFLCYSGLGMYDSVNYYFEQYYNANEARNDELTNKHILDIEAKYQLAQRKKEIELAQKEKRLVELENEEKKHTISQLMLYILAAVLAVILLLVITYNIRRKAKRKIAGHRQKIENLIKDQSILSIQSQIEGQEKERQRIAKDLHDKVGGYLATIKLSVDQLAKENDDLKSIQKLTSTTIDEVRSISHNLDSEALQTDLHQLLIDLGENISSHGTMHSDVIYSVNSHLTVGLKKDIYACAMELVTNSLKHSKADEIVIQVMEVENTIQLLYEDNGVGFNPEDIKAGIGIKNIKSRVDKHSGKIIIDSNKNAGCTIIIEFPL